jgi:hypothetical protein
MDRFVLLVEVVVKIGGLEVWLVGNVVDGSDAEAVYTQVNTGRVGLEDVVEAGLEVRVTAHQFDHSLDVMRDDKGVLWMYVSIEIRELKVISPKAVPS